MTACVRACVSVCRNSNAEPFDHESDGLPLSYPRSTLICSHTFSFSFFWNCDVLLLATLKPVLNWANVSSRS